MGLWLELTLPKTLTLTIDPNPQNEIVEGGHNYHACTPEKKTRTVPRRSWRCRGGNGGASAIPLRIDPTSGGTAEVLNMFKVAAVPPRRFAILTVFRGNTAINDGTSAEPRRSWRYHCGLCRAHTAVAPRPRCDGDTELCNYWRKHWSAELQGAALTCYIPTGRCHDECDTILCSKCRLQIKTGPNHCNLVIFVSYSRNLEHCRVPHSSWRRPK